MIVGDMFVWIVMGLYIYIFITKNEFKIFQAA